MHCLTFLTNCLLIRCLINVRQIVLSWEDYINHIGCVWHQRATDREENCLKRSFYSNSILLLLHAYIMYRKRHDKLGPLCCNGAVCCNHSEWKRNINKKNAVLKRGSHCGRESEFCLTVLWYFAMPAPLLTPPSSAFQKEHFVLVSIVAAAAVSKLWCQLVSLCDTSGTTWSSICGFNKTICFNTLWSWC